jgi:hypothetical protein
MMVHRHMMLHRHIKMRTALLMLVTTALLSGCHPAPPEEKIDASVWESPHALGVSHTSAVAAVEGELPLAYEVGASGLVQVVDESTGKPVATAEARAGQIVAVSARGVNMGGAMISGPVPPGHRYEIVIEITNPEAGPPAPGKEKK